MPSLVRSGLGLIATFGIGVLVGLHFSIRWMTLHQESRNAPNSRFESALLRTSPLSRDEVESGEHRELCAAGTRSALDEFCNHYNLTVPDGVPFLAAEAGLPQTVAPAYSAPSPHAFTENSWPRGHDAKAVKYLFTQWRKVAAEVKRLRLLADIRPGRPTHNLLYPFPIVSASASPGAAVCGSSPAAKLFSASTLNIWNTNEWNSRRPAIARALAALDLDVVALQEVRLLSASHELESQAHQLLNDIQNFEKQKGGSRTGGHFTKAIYETVDKQLMEGLAILTRHKVLRHRLHLLGGRNSNEAQKTTESVRGVLHAVLQIEANSRDIVHVFNVHLGIDDHPQCQHVYRLLEIMRNEITKDDQGSTIILMGDFNAYFDFEWPVDLLTGRLAIESERLMELLEPCSKSLLPETRSSSTMNLEPQLIFKDAFESLHPPEEIPLKGDLERADGALLAHGYTYGTQTMGHDWSRPDRIMWVTTFDSDTAKKPLFGAPCECGNFGVGVLKVNDARFKKSPGIGLSDHLGVVARWPLLS